MQVSHDALEARTMGLYLSFTAPEFLPLGIYHLMSEKHGPLPPFLELHVINGEDKDKTIVFTSEEAARRGSTRPEVYYYLAQSLVRQDRWQEALKSAADRCEAVLFLVSPAWQTSRWCLAEFLLAKQLGKTIFGVLVEATPLEALPREMTAEWQLCDLVLAPHHLRPVLEPSESGLTSMFTMMRSRVI